MRQILFSERSCEDEGVEVYPESEQQSYELKSAHPFGLLLKCQLALEMNPSSRVYSFRIHSFANLNILSNNAVRADINLAGLAVFYYNNQDETVSIIHENFQDFS